MSRFVRQSPMNIDEFRSPRQTSPYSPRNRRESNRTLENLVMKSNDQRSTSRSPEKDSNNRTLRRLMANEPINPRSSRLSEEISLKSLLVDGKWKYRLTTDDKLRLHSLGIENLVNICHDIMTETKKSVEERPTKRKLTPTRRPGLGVVRLDRFEQITDREKRSLKEKKVLNLMKIVHDAASTDASISNLVRIWREVVEHNSRPRPFPIFDDKNQPRISYPTAINRLVREPHDQIFQIGLHAALIGTHSRKDLLRLGAELGVDRENFDIRTIIKSSESFQEFIHFLRAQRLIQRRKQFQVDTSRIPYKPKKRRGLNANILTKKFPIVRQVIENSGFTIRPENDLNCDLLWVETKIPLEILAALKSHQKINQFVGMNEISEKNLFFKNYQKLSSIYPQWFRFVPKTWLLPDEHHLWFSEASKRAKKDRQIYILKSFESNPIEIHCDFKRMEPKSNGIIQEYIREPLLFDGFKFDFRVFVLVTSCDPLRTYIYNEGLVRLSPQKYENPHLENQSNLRIHSTHHFIDYETIQDDLDVNFQQKKSLSSLFTHLARQNCDIKALWQKIQDIVIKTMFIAEPQLLSSYRKSRPGTTLTSESVAFELLSFEFLLDQNFQPWLIEVERSPNFDIPEQIDFDLKFKLLFDTIELLRFRLSDREKSSEIERIEKQHQLLVTLGKTNESETLTLEEKYSLIKHDNERDEFEKENVRNFVRLFPVTDKDRMNELIEILRLSFENFDTKTNEISFWSRKYSFELNENALFHQISRFRRRSTSTDNESKRKPVATQTPKDFQRVKSSTQKKSTGDVSRPKSESREVRPGVSANRIVQKEFYQDRQTNEHERRRSSSPKSPRSNDKSQMVTPEAIRRATRILPEEKSKRPDEFLRQLTKNDFDRLNQLVFEQFDKYSIVYPEKTQRETQNISAEIIENWERFEPLICRFWFAELDREKRESVVEIVWRNFCQILKKICLVDELIEEFPLNRHILTLKRRLLSNKGYVLWETCLNRHHSWESVFLLSTNHLTETEMNCCHRFVELCQESLFILYRYSNDQN